jgi:hypothetical protein
VSDRYCYLCEYFFVDTAIGLSFCMKPVFNLAGEPVGTTRGTKYKPTDSLDSCGAFWERSPT